jgi:membrane protein DedA with SNARE-associated domain
MSALDPGLLHLHIHLHIHLRGLTRHQFHGPPFDYVGLAVASAISWVGLPGPGEPLLIAAGVLAAKHELSLASVLFVAFGAATAGGILGWAVGLIAGRALITGPGPLRATRIHVVERGEAIFERYPVIAILLTPAFVAGIHRVRPAVYQAVNVISAAVWTLVLGVGGYYIGPPVLDAFDDAGTAVTVLVIGVVVVAVGLEVWRRRRRAARRA